MGIHCEINLFKPGDGTFAPGNIVSGVIKYALDEDTAINNVTVSLKGKGNLTLKHKQHHANGSPVTYSNKEKYVEIDNIINDVNNDGKEYIISVGSYETPFSFTLPNDIPASLNYKGNTGTYWIKCQIKYYIRIKFDRPGLFHSTKRFKKELTVVTGITPKLPVTPTICGERKILTQIFSSKASIVNIKATIQNCVIQPGDNVQFAYEVFNDTNVTIKGIETKLVEIYKFTSSGGHKATKVKDIPYTDSKTAAVKSGETQKMDVKILVPLDRSCLENSKMVSRDYAVRIIVEIPLPHRNAILEIPVQVGDTDMGEEVATGGDAPPSYWEVMGEETRDSDGEDMDDVKRKPSKYVDEEKTKL